MTFVEALRHGIGLDRQGEDPFLCHSTSVHRIRNIMSIGLEPRSGENWSLTNVVKGVYFTGGLTDSVVWSPVSKKDTVVLGVKLRRLVGDLLTHDLKCSNNFCYQGRIQPEDIVILGYADQMEQIKNGFFV
jgi:hypothetical protein